MGSIATIIEQVLKIDGKIQIIPYKDEIDEKFKNLALWEIEKTNKKLTTYYKNLSWNAPNEKLAITFNDANKPLSFELKALVLGMITHGAGQGMEPIKWNTTRRIIIHSKRFGNWLAQRQIASINALNSLPLLVTRNLISDFLLEKNANKSVHVAQGISSAVYWWKVYGLVTNSSVLDLFSELLAPYLYKKQKLRHKHSVIPTQVMKQLLSVCEVKLELAIKHYDHWAHIQKNLNDRISTLTSGHFNKDTYINALNHAEKEELCKLHPHFEQIRRYVFILVLAYSGMRHGEVIALDDHAAFEKNGKYYLRSYLSKTTDDLQELEWVVSKSAYDGVKLVDQMNAIYRKRASLLSKFYGDKLPAKKSQNMVFGASTSKLFQVTHCCQSARFNEHVKPCKNAFTNINQLFTIKLTKEDIEQLEKLSCNNQSVSHNSLGFRKPYKVGMAFNFTSHQFRHTFAWFIVANRLGDLDDIKYQFKHLESSMSLVYSHRGYDSMAELLRLTEKFEEHLTSQAMDDMVGAAKDGQLAGRGGQKFIERLQSILGDDFENGSSPHFKNMQELVTYAAKHSQNFRGLSHGYCTKGNACKVRNAADPSHCINCDSYIATPKHLPHWKVIKQRCEKQLAAFEDFPDEIKPRFESFKGALIDNLCAANTIIQQLEISVRKA